MINTWGINYELRIVESPLATLIYFLPQRTQREKEKNFFINNYFLNKEKR